MTSDYDRYRQRLEQQLRADVELLFEAYRAKLRAYETVARARGELGSGAEIWPTVKLPSNLLPAASGAGAALQSPPAPSPAAAPPRPARSEPFAVHDAIDQALLVMGKTFDRRDLCRALGFEPSRATLHRVMSELEQAGTIAVQQRSSGRVPTLYRKVAPDSPAEPEAADAG